MTICSGCAPSTSPLPRLRVTGYDRNEPFPPRTVPIKGIAGLSCSVTEFGSVLKIVNLTYVNTGAIPVVMPGSGSPGFASPSVRTRDRRQRKPARRFQRDATPNAPTTIDRDPDRASQVLRLAGKAMALRALSGDPSGPEIDSAGHRNVAKAVAAPPAGLVNPVVCRTHPFRARRVLGRNGGRYRVGATSIGSVTEPTHRLSGSVSHRPTRLASVNSDHAQ